MPLAVGPRGELVLQLEQLPGRPPAFYEGTVNLWMQEIISCLLVNTLHGNGNCKPSHLLRGLWPSIHHPSLSSISHGKEIS